jgi:hypothetical protein
MNANCHKHLSTLDPAAVVSDRRASSTQCGKRRPADCVSTFAGSFEHPVAGYLFGLMRSRQRQMELRSISGYSATALEA